LIKNNDLSTDKEPDLSVEDIISAANMKKKKKFLKEKNRSLFIKIDGNQEEHHKNNKNPNVKLSELLPTDNNHANNDKNMEGLSKNDFSFIITPTGKKK